MPDQVQCPNCGGFRVIAAKKSAITRRGDPVPVPRGERIFDWVIGFPLLTGAITYGIVVIVSEGEISGPWEVTVALFVILGLPALIASALLMWIYHKIYHKWRSKQRPLVTEGYLYTLECRLCGYEFSWDSRTPKPSVRVDPALIAIGEQKLREQEERQRMIELDALRRRQLEDER